MQQAPEPEVRNEWGFPIPQQEPLNRELAEAALMQAGLNPDDYELGAA